MKDFSSEIFDLSDFSVVYQPIYNIKTQDIFKLEALLRWNKSVHVEEYITHFEKTGKIYGLTLFVVQRVCEDLEQISMSCSRPVVTINFSPMLLSNTEFVTNIIIHISNQGIPADWIEIEITEAERSDIVLLANNAHVLRDHGFSLSMDDFGKGSTSFDCLIQLPVSTLKIDKKFIGTVESCSTSRAILSSISHLRKKLGINCVTEGIETKEQEAFLMEIGLEHGQGFLFSRPVTLDKILMMFHRSLHEKMVDQVDRHRWPQLAATGPILRY